MGQHHSIHTTTMINETDWEADFQTQNKNSLSVINLYIFTFLTLVFVINGQSITNFFVYTVRLKLLNYVNGRLYYSFSHIFKLKNFSEIPFCISRSRATKLKKFSKDLRRWLLRFSILQPYFYCNRLDRYIQKGKHSPCLL